MSLKASFAIAVLGLACVSTGCGSEPAAAAAGGTKGSVVSAGTDAGAMTDLQASATWKEPRCRWLETGAHILAYPQDTEVLKAARDLGYIELEQVGTGNRTGTAEAAWKVKLTEAGAAESAKCGKGSSRSTVFGVPVSQRKFIAGKRFGEPDKFVENRTIFEVEFEWTPTPAGDRVKYVLTDSMTVEQGLATAKIVMLYGDRVTNKGANGWGVQSINDTRIAGR